MTGSRYFFASLTRISDLKRVSFEVQPLPRPEWRMGDYVAAEVIGTPSPGYLVELDSGRMVEAVPGDRIIGAFGKRAATLEGVGDWERIGADERMHSLTAAGLFGKVTSASPLSPRFMSLHYQGHVLREGSKLTMDDFVQPVAERQFNKPVILLVGTSMSAGKTTTGRVIIRSLKESGLRVAAAKMTGAGRYRDVLSFSDAGADYIFDFVDVGMPSTVYPPEEFRPRLRQLLSRIAQLDVDLLVAEAGASPLEPYNGDIAIEEISEHLCCTVLSASDPYAVVGVQTAFNLKPDLITGPAANTDSAITLVEKLTGVKALNLVKPESLPALRSLIQRKLRY